MILYFNIFNNKNNKHTVIIIKLKYKHVKQSNWSCSKYLYIINKTYQSKERVTVTPINYSLNSLTNLDLN